MSAFPRRQRGQATVLSLRSSLRKVFFLDATAPPDCLEVVALRCRVAFSAEDGVADHSKQVLFSSDTTHASLRVYLLAQCFNQSPLKEVTSGALQQFLVAVSIARCGNKLADHSWKRRRT